MVDRGCYLPRSSDERALLIKTALDEGHCVIISMVGALVDTKERALDAFRRAIAMRGACYPDAATVVVSVEDPEGREAIAVYANEPGALYLYGVSEADFLVATADLRSDTVQ